MIPDRQQNFRQRAGCGPARPSRRTRAIPTLTPEQQAKQDAISARLAASIPRLKQVMIALDALLEQDKAERARLGEPAAPQVDPRIVSGLTPTIQKQPQSMLSRIRLVFFRCLSW